MSYAAILQDLPQDLQLPILKLVEAVEENLRDQLAVRREDFDSLRAVVHDLAEAQKRTEQRVEELAEAQKRTEQRVEELAEAQKRTEQRVEELAEAQKRTEQRVEELAEAQKRTEQRLDRLEVAVLELAEAQKRTEQRLDRLEVAVLELAEAQKRTEEEIRKLTEKQTSMDLRLGQLVGEALERRYRDKAYAYLGRVLRGVHTVSVRELEADLERHLSEAELDDLFLLDVLVRGRLGPSPEAPLVWLAIEVSAVVDRLDVERAQRRAALLRKAGYKVIPAVAGEEATAGGEQAARVAHVLLLQDGKKQFWDEALAEALSA